MIIRVEAFEGYPGQREYNSSIEIARTINDIGVFTKSLPDSLANKPMGQYKPQFRKDLEAGKRGYIITVRGHVKSEGLSLEWFPGYPTPPLDQLFVPRSYLEETGLEAVQRIKDREWVIKLRAQPEVVRSQPSWQTKKGVFD